MRDMLHQSRCDLKETQLAIPRSMSASWGRHRLDCNLVERSAWWILGDRIWLEIFQPHDLGRGGPRSSLKSPIPTSTCYGRESVVRSAVFTHGQAHFLSPPVELASVDHLPDKCVPRATSPLMRLEKRTRTHQWPGAYGCSGTEEAGPLCPPCMLLPPPNTGGVCVFKSSTAVPVYQLTTAAVSEISAAWRT